MNALVKRHLSKLILSSTVKIESQKKNSGRKGMEFLTEGGKKRGRSMPFFPGKENAIHEENRGRWGFQKKTGGERGTGVRSHPENLLGNRKAS